jgi:hypothetical protein
LKATGFRSHVALLANDFSDRAERINS